MYGYHESLHGGLQAALARVVANGANSFQVFLGSPFQTKPPTKDTNDDEMKQALRDAGVNMFVHGPYTINLAKPPNARWQIILAARMLDLSHRAGSGGLVFHMGKCNTKNERFTIEEGIQNMKDTIDAILAQSTTQGRLLLETSAGQGSELCWQWDDFYRFAQDVIGQYGTERVAICLDTCHLFAAGHDLSKEFFQSIDPGLVKLIHLNDSKGPMGCRRDRHELLGHGHIPTLIPVIEWASMHGIPMILETKPPWGPQLDFIRNHCQQQQ